MDIKGGCPCCRVQTAHFVAVSATHRRYCDLRKCIQCHRFTYNAHGKVTTCREKHGRMVGMSYRNVSGELDSKNGFGVNLNSRNKKFILKIHRFCLYTECLQGSLHCRDEATKDPCALKFTLFPNESISPLSYVFKQDWILLEIY